MMTGTLVSLINQLKACQQAYVFYSYKGNDWTQYLKHNANINVNSNKVLLWKKEHQMSPTRIRITELYLNSYLPLQKIYLMNLNSSSIYTKVLSGEISVNGNIIKENEGINLYTNNATIVSLNHSVTLQLFEHYKDFDCIHLPRAAL